MTTTLITGGSIDRLTACAIHQIALGERVVALHEFPDRTADRLPNNVITVFDIADDGLSTEAIAEIYQASRIIDLDTFLPVILKRNLN